MNRGHYLKRAINIAGNLDSLLGSRAGAEFVHLDCSLTNVLEIASQMARERHSLYRQAGFNGHRGSFARCKEPLCRDVRDRLKRNRGVPPKI